MQKNSKGFIGCLIIFAYFIMFIASTPQRTTTKTNYSPGWYGITSGWNDGRTDIDGQVGYSLYVSGPRGRCIHCKNCESGSWSSDESIVSGSFPPGMSWASGASISGTPTERGHWIVRVRLSNIKCGESYYRDFEQELRFHITGTGKVNN